MKKGFFITLAVALAVFSSTAAMGQQPDSTATKAKNKVVDYLADHIQVHGYAQGGYNYTHKDGKNTNTFELKRTLFWVNAQFTDRWSFLFMHDFSSVVQEYYIDFRATRNKALTIRLGQFKNGLSLENPLSPTSMEAIDVYSEGVTFLTGCGSDPLLGVQYGRDLGLSLFGETNNGKFRYEIDVMNGQGINRKDGNRAKDVIGRIEYRPVKGLNLVATGQIGRGHAIAPSLYNPGIQYQAKTATTPEVCPDYKRDRVTVGFDYKSKAINIHGEYLEGWDGDVSSRGAYITGNVPLGKSKCDIVGSYDYFNFNTDLNMDQHKAIIGLQYWFYHKCRLQVQYVYKSAYTANGAFIHGSNHAIMCQMQIRLDYMNRKLQ